MVHHFHFEMMTSLCTFLVFNVQRNHCTSHYMTEHHMPSQTISLAQLPLHNITGHQENSITSHDLTEPSKTWQSITIWQAVCATIRLLMKRILTSFPSFIYMTPPLGHANNSPSNVPALNVVNVVWSRAMFELSYIVDILLWIFIIWKLGYTYSISHIWHVYRVKL